MAAWPSDVPINIPATYFRKAMMAATFGYLLPTREMVMSQGAPDIGRFIGLAERAEELGFDSIWAGDSVLARPRLEALTTPAAGCGAGPKMGTTHV